MLFTDYLDQMNDFPQNKSTLLSINDSRINQNYAIELHIL
jgi:hypothetical protein